MKKIITSTLLLTTLSISAIAYDSIKAQTMDNFYSKFTQKACADSKLFISAEETMKMLRENKKFMILDIRTRGERAVVSIGLENSIYIPIKDLFKKENLDKLPTDQTIILVCHSGTRATLAAIGLKQIGIKKTRVLKGGLVALADANNPKNAPLR
ncbi:MAG: rhodanese-like domain-containing protein [Campylobacterota bacterium]|nr:rhodanese-like domain-containing protein [Campylobacterota bacterium]